MSVKISLTEVEKDGLEQKTLALESLKDELFNLTVSLDDANTAFQNKQTEIAAAESEISALVRK